MCVSVSLNKRFPSTGYINIYLFDLSVCVSCVLSFLSHSTLGLFIYVFAIYFIGGSTRVLLLSCNVYCDDLSAYTHTLVGKNEEKKRTERAQVKSSIKICGTDGAHVFLTIYWRCLSMLFVYYVYTIRFLDAVAVWSWPLFERHQHVSRDTQCHRYAYVCCVCVCVCFECTDVSTVDACVPNQCTTFNF